MILSPRYESEDVSSLVELSVGFLNKLTVVCKSGMNVSSSSAASCKIPTECLKGNNYIYLINYKNLLCLKDTFVCLFDGV